MVFGNVIAILVCPRSIFRRKMVGKTMDVGVCYPSECFSDPLTADMYNRQSIHAREPSRSVAISFYGMTKPKEERLQLYSIIPALNLCLHRHPKRPKKLHHMG